MTLRILFTLIILAASGAYAQNITIYGKDGSRTDFREGEVQSIDFNAPDRKPLTLPDGVESVDLGLSVNWASCNLGAQSSADTGAYLAWAETEEKANYTWDTYFDPRCERPLEGISGMPPYDVVAATWGGDWRLPTLEEMQELCDRCSWTWTEQDGHKGCTVTGPSGASIFLPAAGTRQGTDLYLADNYGAYLTGTRDESNHFYVRSLVFFSTAEHWLEANLRDYGQSVRAVCK